MTLQIGNLENVSQVDDSSFVFISAFAALVVGFLLKVLFDHLKAPMVKILTASKEPFLVNEGYRDTETGPFVVVRTYNAYRIRVENVERRYLNCAAENCIAWIELDSAPEAYQVAWIGGPLK